MEKIKNLGVIFIITMVVVLGSYSYSNAENETTNENNNNSQVEENTSKEENNTTENQTDTNNTVEENTGDNNNQSENEQTNQEEQNSEPEPEPEQETETTTQTQNKNQSQSQTETKKSNNANLSNLGIDPNDFKGFKPDILEYNVTVKNDVEKVKVYAKLQDSKAKITSGVGEHSLNVGMNALSVIVTAEDGTKKVYTIKVTREEAKQEEKEEEKKEEKETVATVKTTQNLDLKKLEVKGYTLTPSFSASVYEYKLNVSKDVTSLDIVTEGQNDKINIEIVGNTDLQDGDNTITVLVKNTETNKNSTYQIIVTKGDQKAENVSVEKAKKVRFVLIGLFGIIVIAGIVTFKIMNKKQDDFEDIKPQKQKAPKEPKNKLERENNPDKNNDRLDLDDEQELFKRVNKADFKNKLGKENKREMPNNSRKPANTKNVEEYFQNPNNQRERHF